MSVLLDPLQPFASPAVQQPALLEYRGESDPDGEYIPKTIAGFALGTLAMGFCLDIGERVLLHMGESFKQVMPDFGMHVVFILGIVGVSTSLFLVGLKVRADHAAVTLYAKHWLNSIGTGAFYAFLVWLPWALIEHGISVNRFLAVAFWMCVMAFPAIAAKWTIGPHRTLSRPA